MKKILILIIAVGALACASKKTAELAANIPVEKKFSGPITMQSTIPYATGAAEDKIKTECPEVSVKLSDFTKEHGTEIGVEFTQKATIDTKAKGAVLVMEIVNMHSGGNAFIGHNKSTTVKAQLYKDGVLIDTVERTRSSGGGFAAGFKGSCSVLGRTVKALGVDVADWAKTYKM